MKNNRIASFPSQVKLVYWISLIALTVVLIFRLFYLQILHKTDYKLQSDQNRIREVTLKPLRGLIYDRNKTLIVNNSPAFSLHAIPYNLQNNPDLYNRIGEYINKTPEELKAAVRRNMRGYFLPVRLMRQVDISIVTRFEEMRMEFPGVGFWIEPIRSYPSSVRAAHVLGYLGEITSTELKNKSNPEYQSGDVIGKRGIESFYDEKLRGKSGLEYVEVDALGREVKKLKNPLKEKSIPGLNLDLTLDVDLQTLAEESMGESRGSIIMLDLEDGGVLAMVSKPDFNPRDLAGVISPTVWRNLQNNPEHPFYNRSLQSLYPPGSTYKIVVVMAAIANKVIKPTSVVNCAGSYRFGVRYFKCWKSKGHGRMNWLKAIEQSCNVYFYQLGLKVGLDEWSKFSRIFLFGKKTGVDFPLENSGLVPDHEYFDNRYGEKKWTKGLLVNLSIGQGDLLVTTLQMVQFAGIIAKRGIYHKPHLLKSTQNQITQETIVYESSPLKIEELPEEAYDIVHEGMFRVVNGEKGTAKAARVPGINVAGKTGTAQNSHGNDHAWFIGFAPRENPRVAIVVLIENGGGGGSIAAPKAGKLLKLYFQKYPAETPSSLASKN